MSKQSELPLDGVPEAPRIGRDELNLTEFPFAVLASKGSKDSPLIIEFRDGDKEWVVQGSPKYGLPTAVDVDLYVVLMELTREQGFPERVTFTRYELIERLNWAQTGWSYERLVQGLHRLRGISISAKNAFYDAKRRRWERERSIGIIAEFDISGSQEAGTDEPAPFASWITWSPHLYRNMQAGHLKSLDVQMFLSLESSIAKALYRYLDAKRYDGKPQYRIGLKKLAFEHLGLSRNYYPSQIKRKLDPAHAELIERGFLSEASYAEMKTQPGEQMVIYRFPARPSRVALPEPSGALVQRLQEQGVSRKDAQDLALQDPEECQRQLDYLPFRGADNPGGMLVKAIREGWAPPAEWQKAQKKKAQSTRQRTHSQTAPAEGGADPFEDYWTALPEARQQELLEQAQEKLRTENGFVWELGRKNPGSKTYHEMLKKLLKELSNWKSPLVS